ncbi:MAG: cytochrome c biogenesis protein ResB [Candidatus Protistobacter heckmanni]|nr:cytochrome c biogenesis protein ResB [Candidatus Protistobacter heckmanni]
MRFAISLLSLIAIASIVGTVLKQNEPFPNYVNQFGPFWADLFGKLSLYTVHSSWWFLLILAFLVTSTTLCILRTWPKLLADMRAWKDGIQERSLRAVHDHAEFESPLSREQLRNAAARLAEESGYRLRIAERAPAHAGAGQASLIAAKRGAANRLGYLFAHCGIVVVCVGGLLDGDLLVRMQLLFGGKQALPPSQQSMLISDIPADSKLSAGNLSFRGNMFVPEGATAGAAVLSAQDGTLIQELPFSVTLKKFTVDYYSTGMPKLFASDIVVTDRATGEKIPATVKVNQPFTYKGVSIYQSSFEDGGSKLELTGYPMRGGGADAFTLKGEVGGSTQLAKAAGKGSKEPGVDESYTVEFTGFRPINVENLTDASGRNDARGVAASRAEQFEARLGSGAKTSRPKDLRNVGPSVQYKLRDRAGQAREFSNYMLPLTADGQKLFLAGVREQPDEPFRYLRIPADADGSVKEWMRLRAALADPAQRREAARRYAAKYAPPGAPAAQLAQLRTQLEASAGRALDLFAGPADKSADMSGQPGQDPGGFQSVARFLGKTVPAAEQDKAADVLLKILNGAIWDLWQISRERAGFKQAELTQESGVFLQTAVNALSDSVFYGAPVYLQLSGFDEVKASVFQLTRSPGKYIVYLGCLLLVAGVFGMFYIRERRLWILVKDLSGQTGQGLDLSASAQGFRSSLLMAMTSGRRTLDFNKEVALMRERLAQCAGAA